MHIALITLAAGWFATSAIFVCGLLVAVKRPTPQFDGDVFDLSKLADERGPQMDRASVQMSFLE